MLILSGLIPASRSSTPPSDNHHLTAAPPLLVLDWSAEIQINELMPKRKEAVVWHF